MNDHLKAITKYVEAINATLPEGIDGEGPIRQMLGEIVAEATALDNQRDTAQVHLDYHVVDDAIRNAREQR